jgi:hypothetical protein
MYFSSGAGTPAASLTYIAVSRPSCISDGESPAPAMNTVSFMARAVASSSWLSAQL